jgi:deoxyribodipyrimidine photo-lyase
MTPRDFPDLRIRVENSAGPNVDGDYVLYWMTSFRRTEWNFSLQRAVDWSRCLRKPLIVLETLRCDYRWASDRFHHFVIQGMADNARRLAKKPVLYYPYVETRQGAEEDLLAHLGKRACLVVGDDFPDPHLQRVVSTTALRNSVGFELIDSSGILPLRATERVFTRAHDFRRYLQKNLRPHLLDFPDPDPFFRVRLPRLEELALATQAKWPPADVQTLANYPQGLAHFSIDHHVASAPLSGGSRAARKQLRNFLKNRIAHYGADRNQPEIDATSGLSPYLHFGHLSAHEVFCETVAHDNWSPAKLANKVNGSAHGWWGASENVESFLDELVTWREVGFNMAAQREDYDEFSSLPDWAKKTLAEHAHDLRDHLYGLEQFEKAKTHDPLWNAAQRQLTCEGRIHNYLRMLWGKKILEWSATPEDALQVMIELNNKYALDGRDPNSYSGIFWILGRYDRAWGPERPIFGKVRYMSSENTARKVRVKKYIEKFGSA